MVRSTVSLSSLIIQRWIHKLNAAVCQEQAQPVPVFGDALPGSRYEVSMKGDLSAAPKGALAEARARFSVSQALNAAINAAD